MIKEFMETKDQLEEIEKELRKIKTNIDRLENEPDLSIIKSKREEVRKELKLGIRVIKRKTQMFDIKLSKLDEKI